MYNLVDIYIKGEMTLTTLVPINIPAWMLMVIPVLLILIIYTILKNNSVDKSKIETDKETSINWIKKKDLLYWLIIICLGAISIFSFKYRKAAEMIDHWGFAGTIISIILAILAIIYTYYQSATTVDSTKRLERSAKKVQKATTRVEEATNELKNNNIETVVLDLEKRLGNILSKMQNEITDELRTMPFLKNDNSPTDISLNMSDEDWEKYVHKNIIKELTFEGLTISFAYYLFIHNEQYTYTNESAQKWFENMKQDKTGAEIGGYILLGQLRLFRSLNIINYEPTISENENIARLSNINDLLKKEMDEIFQSQDNNAFFKQAIDALNKTFGKN